MLKAGGRQLQTEAGIARLAEDLEHASNTRIRTVVVHGGGGEVSEYQERTGLEVRKVLGLRVTDDEAMDTTSMVLCGLVNKRAVAYLNGRGFRAAGFCGADFGLMRSALLNEARLGRVGGPPRVEPGPILTLLDAGWTLLIAPVCLGPDGRLVNVNADTAAQSLAVALDAEMLDFASDIEAVRGANGPVRTASAAQIDTMIAGPAVQGGMVPKLQAALAALEGGVGQVRIGNFRSLANGRATAVHA